jgi:hypothetical protein
MFALSEVCYSGDLVLSLPSPPLSSPFPFTSDLSFLSRFFGARLLPQFEMSRRNTQRCRQMCLQGPLLYRRRLLTERWQIYDREVAEIERDPAEVLVPRMQGKVVLVLWAGLSQI